MSGEEQMDRCLRVIFTRQAVWTEPSSFSKCSLLAKYDPAENTINEL